MAIARKFLAWTGIFVLGLLFGPLLVAAIAGLAASTDDDTRWRSAYQLLNAYDELYPEYALPSLNWAGAASDCGYDFEQLFGSATPPSTEGRGSTPFTGYFDLILWESGEFREEVERRRAEHLARRFSGFELTFLNGCVRHSVFAYLCGRRVGKTLSTGRLDSRSSLPANGPRFNQTRQSTTLCRYLDGLAARQGQPLAYPAESIVAQ